MKKGLVLGKFMPLHAGHIAMVRFALQHCDNLTVMLCASDKEPVTGSVRQQWLTETFQQEPRVHIALVAYDEAVLPNSSVSSRSISKLWADYIRQAFPGIDVFISSEPYGEYVAGYLGIEHQSFDPEREQVPVAASAILREPFKHWDFIAPAARPYFVKKICISGSESTGKSTLTERLALHFQTAFVPEMARAVIETTEEVVYEDLFAIANLHALTIEQKIKEANKLLICDTGVQVTRSYAQYLFQRELVVETWIEEANRFDLHIFLTTDCDYIQDGTRLNEADRNKLSSYHETQLKKEGIVYITIGGNWEERFEKAKQIITEHFFK